MGCPSQRASSPITGEKCGHIARSRTPWRSVSNSRDDRPNRQPATRFLLRYTDHTPIKAIKAQPTEFPSEGCALIFILFYRFSPTSRQQVYAFPRLLGKPAGWMHKGQAPILPSVPVMCYTTPRFHKTLADAGDCSWVIRHTGGRQPCAP